MSNIGWSNFVIWQCSLRQRNFRMFNGKPSEGIIALILDNKSNKEIASLRSVLIEKNSLNTAKMFEFMIKKTNDPEERFDKAVKFSSDIQKLKQIRENLRSKALESPIFDFVKFGENFSEMLWKMWKNFENS